MIAARNGNTLAATRSTAQHLSVPSDVDLEREVIQRFERALRSFQREVRACVEASMFHSEELNELLVTLDDAVPDVDEWDRLARNRGKE